MPNPLLSNRLDGEGIYPSLLRIQMIKDNKATAGLGLCGIDCLCCTSVVCAFRLKKAGLCCDDELWTHCGDA